MHLFSNEANMDKISFFISHIHRNWMIERERERKAETLARSYEFYWNQMGEYVVCGIRKTSSARRKKSSSRKHYHFYNVLIYVHAQKNTVADTRCDRCNDAPQMEIYSKINFHKIVNEEILIRCANTISGRVRCVHRRHLKF